MAPPKSRKRVASEDYESDDGFVEDAPKSKKNKTTSNSTSGSFGEQIGDDGGEFWEINRTRRVQISEFKGKTMIGIREFYEKDGKMLPGKKGISLTMEQFNAVVQLLPKIDGLLTSKGLVVDKPEYPGQQEGSSNADEHAETVAEDTEQPQRKIKANHEATSDEEENE